jgi:hypothetical protein
LYIGNFDPPGVGVTRIGTVPTYADVYVGIVLALVCGNRNGSYGTWYTRTGRVCFDRTEYSSCLHEPVPRTVTTRCTST